MAEFPLILPLLIAIGAAVGVAVGWFLRGRRVGQEKAAIHASWRDQMEAQRLEHDRIAEQNRNLMESISRDRSSRAKAEVRIEQLAEALREAETARDAAEQRLRETRSNLAVAERQRDTLKRAADEAAPRARDSSLREKDEKIFKLSRELETWQSRLPPLLERFRQRDLEAQQLEIELEKANAELASSDRHAGGEVAGTRIEQVDDAAVASDLDASNEQFDDEHASPPAADRPLNGGTTSLERSGIAAYMHERKVDFDIGAAEPAEDVDVPAGIADVFEEPPPGSEPGDRGTSARAAGTADDLQRIKGVGPAIEKMLNRLGIFRYEQIADFTEFDIDRVAGELKGFRSRLYREDWIGQARMLELEKDG